LPSTDIRGVTGIAVPGTAGHREGSEATVPHGQRGDWRQVGGGDWGREGRQPGGRGREAGSGPGRLHHQQGGQEGYAEPPWSW